MYARVAPLMIPLVTVRSRMDRAFVGLMVTVRSRMDRAFVDLNERWMAPKARKVPVTLLRIVLVERLLRVAKPRARIANPRIVKPRARIVNPWLRIVKPWARIVKPRARIVTP